MKPWWEKYNRYWDRVGLKDFVERAQAMGLGTPIGRSFKA